MSFPDINSWIASRSIEPFDSPSAHMSLVSTQNNYCNTFVSSSSLMYWMCDNTPLSAGTLINVEVIDTNTLCASTYNAIGMAYHPYSLSCRAADMEVLPM